MSEILLEVLGTYYSTKTHYVDLLITYKIWKL